MQADSPWLINGAVNFRHGENLASEVLARTCQLGDGVRFSWQDGHAQKCMSK